MSEGQMNRREIIGTAAAVAAPAIVPRRVLGGPGYVAPSEKINLAIVGVGTQLLRMIWEFLDHDAIQVTTVCDCNKDSQDYPEWGRWALRRRIREHLEEPTWGKGDTGCRCGRDVGKYVVEKYYAKKFNKASWKGVASYEDYRNMLADDKNIDGLWIMTADHTHAAIACAAMQKGKHTIMHKPLSNVLSEARLVANMAEETGLASHMFCSADKPERPLIKEWIEAGAIGQVREVHNWSNRPSWPQGMTEYPPDTPPVPKGFNWDLWLGPAVQRPYHPDYTHTVFRGWYDFGSGPLGDMGHYSGFQIWDILDLENPVSVEASSSFSCHITATKQFSKKFSQVAFPHASTVRWQFPARGDKAPVDLYWYDGGMRPPVMKELEEDGRKMPNEGLLFVGDEGKIFGDFRGQGARLIPEKAMQAFDRPPQTLPRPVEELDQWVRACRGEKPSDANYKTIQPITETLMLGTIALRIPNKLYWDADTMKFTNSKQADKLLYRKYRKGWELPV